MRSSRKESNCESITKALSAPLRKEKELLEDDSICSSKPGILHDCTKHGAMLVSEVWQRVLNRQTCKIFGRTPTQNESGIVGGVASLGGTLTSYGPMYLF